jgi:hypothetical protein
MGKGADAPPPPDPAIGEAAKNNIELGKEWLSFAKDQFAEGNIRQDATDALTKTVIDQQLSTQDQANAWAKEDRARNDTVFKPLQDQMIDQANAYAAPEKQDEAAAQAKTDVATAFANQKMSTSRQMAAMGINPNSGRSEALSRSSDLAGAVSTAGMENSARQGIRDKALALQGSVSGFGTALSGNAINAAGLGINAGNSALAGNAGANAQWMNNNSVMTNGFSGGISANQSGAGILNNVYSNQASSVNAGNQANAASAAGTGQAIGGIAAAGMMAVAF